MDVLCQICNYILWYHLVLEGEIRILEKIKLFDLEIVHLHFKWKYLTPEK